MKKEVRVKSTESNLINHQFMIGEKAWHFFDEFAENYENISGSYKNISERMKKIWENPIAIKGKDYFSFSWRLEGSKVLFFVKLPTSIH